MIPDGESLGSSADKLMPQYVIKGLPAGISGLIVAGMIAAAMSTLSSGLNSSCAVITVDGSIVSENANYKRSIMCVWPERFHGLWELLSWL